LSSVSGGNDADSGEVDATSEQDDDPEPPKLAPKARPSFLRVVK
jgi:hypothetical protein